MLVKKDDVSLDINVFAKNIYNFLTREKFNYIKLIQELSEESERAKVAGTGVLQCSKGYAGILKQLFEDFYGALEKISVLIQQRNEALCVGLKLRKNLDAANETILKLIFTAIPRFGEENESLKKKIQQLSQENKRLGEENAWMSELSVKTVELERKVSELEKLSEDYKGRLLDKGTEIGRLREEIWLLRREIQSLNDRIETLKQDEREMNSVLDHLESVNQELRKELSIHKNQVATLTKENTESTEGEDLETVVVAD